MKREENAKRNDLEGIHQGGKHGGQAGVPKPTQRFPNAPQDKKIDAQRSHSLSRIEGSAERRGSATT